MSRIRTIKPEFFTSEDIVSMTPLARILYVAIWCEADREGRMQWKPKTLKMRYLPADDCDIDAVCGELLAQGLVVLYGDGLAYIPSFRGHQHINPREPESRLPAPPVDNDASATRGPRVSDASVTHREEGKGREGKGREDATVVAVPSFSSSLGFPREGSVAYSPYASVIRANAPGRDVDFIAGEFRRFCREKDIAFDHPSIGKTLATFCKKQRAAA